MRKLTEEQRKKLYNNLAICFVVMGLVLELLALVIPWGIFAATQNWGFIILFLIIQLGIMPVIFLICGVSGSIFSVLAVKKNRFKVRYVITICLSVTMILVGIVVGVAGFKNVYGETTKGNVDEWLIKRIENDYAMDQYEKYKFDPEIDGHFVVEYCYGVYGDCVPVMMGGFASTTVVWDDQIGDSVINYRSGNSILVWKKGEFYPLKEAYEQGFLTEEDIREIADIHNNRY